MAEVVQYPEHTKEQYPFDQWFDGRAWLLKRGEDFTVNLDSARRVLHDAAKRRAFTIRTSLLPDGTGLIVQRIDTKAKYM